MTTIAIEGFSGIVPRLGPSRLGPMNAQLASNVKMQSGELRPWQKPVVAYTPLTTAVQAIYLLQGPTINTRWLTWNCDVDVVAGVLADNGDYRIYYTGATFAPRKTNWALASTGMGPYPAAYYELGVPAPTGGPTLTPSSTTAPAETRAYVYTYVTVFGAIQEESAPSPAATVNVSSTGATVTVNGFTAPPAGNYNFQYINIYRSVAGTSTVSYQFVAQIAIGTASYVDALTVTQLGQVLQSTYYTPPPSGLQGLVEMPNGMLAGFVGNQVWFCEPYKPHAWPVTYQQVTEYPIVGLGVFGNSLFVGTTKNPYLITGTTPSSVSQEKLPILQPCVSKRSIVGDQWGVVYASPNGLLAIGPGIQDVITQSLYTRDEWQPLSPASIVGLLYNNMYIGFWNNGTGPTSAFVFSRADTPPLATYDFPASCVYVDRLTGRIYAVSSVDNNIYQLDADPQNATIYQWRSRLYEMTEPTNFGALKVKADYSYIQGGIAYNNQIFANEASNAATFAADASTSLGGCLNNTVNNALTVDGSSLIPIIATEDVRSIQVTIFADGVQVFEAGMTSNDPVRMPAGFKATTWEILITGNTAVRRFTMATTVGELRRA
ncbi:hypothetical protein [Paraburkholderia sp. BL10I2N1]|uniref:hypothetical protein n=1 Tax=Paraburkholderia sp. BL10I2N1 TaxID=1938796 RepID=UPI00105E9261|nr:hypothetical protein [Paraburkholderia sp. BL10I2N1]TDN70398.1 hypothetical protein B0G77_3871 [Paraburkholderia sp. BL10I2N1]